jgi:hypothetical protein
MDHFLEFQSKIAHTIRNAVKPLLEQREYIIDRRQRTALCWYPVLRALSDFSVCLRSLVVVLFAVQSHRGISLVLLSSNSTSDHPHDSGPSSAFLHTTMEVDKLAVLANQQALMGIATDLMGARNDTPQSIVLRSRRSTLVLLRVERASLIVVFKNSVDASLCMKQIEKTAELVKKVLVVASNLKT